MKGGTALPTYHVYRNGRPNAVTVSSVGAPVWPGAPLLPGDQELSLGTVLDLGADLLPSEDADAAGESPGAGA